MKGTFAKVIQRSLVAVLLVFGALAFSTTRAEAQVNGINHNWVTESEALTALEASVALFALDQDNYTPGSTPWVSAVNHIEYYKQVMLAIENGITVPIAVFSTTIQGYNPNPGNVDAAAPILTPAQMEQLRNDATDLLTQ